MKSLDAKLNAYRENPEAKDSFIIADAKDPDMAFGVRALGKRSYLSGGQSHPAQFSPEIWTRNEFGYRNLPEFLDIIREVVDQGLVDIMLMSAHVNEQLTIKERIFRDSHITPAARANDATDVWAVRHGNYLSHPAKPFRSASIDHIQCGKLDCDRSTDEFPGANLGLYSVTYLNDLEQDKQTLEAFHEFREEAERKKFRYFLEVFDPNVDSGISPDKLGEFINDQILRTLAGIAEAGRPVFLKIVYHGPRYMEEICQYDQNMAVGVLGGSAGTTYDAFRLLHDAKKYGARLALFGRKINNAEHQLAFIEFLRLIAEDKISPEEAVHAYHGVLQGKGITPNRTLEKDLELTEQTMRYGSEGNKTSITITKNPLVKKDKVNTKSKITDIDWPTEVDGRPDFGAMTPDQRLAYHTRRLSL
ncbi:MAG: hypothetical protein VX961_07355 [Verrucomicrobiota bacterium]|nr:hypothetical protein [Verrucomicrobiota bacterium]